MTLPPMTMRIVERPSPNFNDRPAGAPIDMIVMHYTGMKTAEEALQRLTEAASKVSAHYTIDEDGTIYRHVAEAKRAWHAGVSHWAGVSNLNDRSVGIEIVNPGHEFGYREFPEPQIAAVIELGKAIRGRHGIPAKRVLGHSDIAPKRKVDPGELFPWKRLAAAGLGVWVEGPRMDISRSIQIPDIQQDLAAIGYECPATGVFDDDTRAVITAFQRHWRPKLVTGIPDGETALLAGLVRRATA